MSKAQFAPPLCHTARMRTHLSLHNLALFSLALLAFSLPFETILFTLGPLQLSNLELLLALVLLSTVALVVARRHWQERGWLRFPRAWLALWALVALALLLSTLLAPEERLNAAKGSARLLSGMALALCVPQILRPRAAIVWIVAPLLVGGFLAALVGLLELSASSALVVLEPFRIMPTAAGPYMRLTSSFDHANQAAMFLEATAPLLVAALLVTFRRRKTIFVTALALLLLVAALLWLQAIIGTYSRAAIVTVIASSAALVLLSPRRKRAWPWAALGLSLTALVALNAFLNPVVRMRWQTEGDNEWYRMQLEAPPALTVDAGHIVTTTIALYNEGIMTWTSDPPIVINAGGHWHIPETGTSLDYRPRWPLPQTVRPGESLTMQVALQAPLRPGSYEFRWDIVQEDVTWFSYKTGNRASTQVTVRPASVAAPPQTPEIELALNREVQAPPDLAPIPDRRTLWRIALQEVAGHPLLGIGMDNFRLIHGRSLGYELWNDTIHTNNWYVEMLVSVGLLGALPFFGWMVLLGIDGATVLRRPRPDVWRVALAGGLLAYFLHGALDYFISSNSTGLLFWLLCGLWVAMRRQTTPADHGSIDANRL